MLWSTNLKEIGTNTDMCHSLTQKTSFSTDFETIQEKRDNTLNQVNTSVELLEYLFDSTVITTIV